MLAKQRSGTRAFGHMIKQHPNVVYLSEVFHKNAQQGEFGFFNFAFEEVKRQPELMYPDRKVEILDRYLNYYQEKNPSPKRIVLDVKYNQTHHFDHYIQERWVDMPIFLRRIMSLKIPVIHICRRNCLATYLSVERAKQSGIWHTKAGEVQTDTFVVDTDDMVREINARQQEMDVFSRWLSNYPHVLTLDYEKMYEDGVPEKGMVEQVSSFLELKNPIVPETDISRQSTGAYEKEVENWEEVKSALIENGLAKFL